MNAPRLTAQQLAELDEAIRCLDETIEYLEDAIPEWPVGSVIRVRLTTKYNNLINARNWIVEQRPKEKKK